MTTHAYDFARAEAYFQDRLDFTTGTHELNVLITDQGNSGDYQIVDVRFPDDFARERIPGAINLPMPKWDNRRYLEAHLRKDATIYLYCYTPTCHLAAQAAKKLAAAGYKAVEVEGGWQGWVEGGYDVERPAAAKSA